MQTGLPYLRVSLSSDLNNAKSLQVWGQLLVRDTESELCDLRWRELMLRPIVIGRQSPSPRVQTPECYLPSLSVPLSLVSHFMLETWLGSLSWPQVNTGPGPARWWYVAAQQTPPPAPGEGSASVMTHTVYANCSLLGPCKTPLFKVITTHQHLEWGAGAGVFSNFIPPDPNINLCVGSHCTL